MLKQSLVQEKLSDLLNNSNGNTNNPNSVVSSLTTNDLKLEKSKTGTELLQNQVYNMPQWPRVQLDKQITSNLKRNTKIIINSASAYEPTIQNLSNNKDRFSTTKQDSVNDGSAAVVSGGIEFDGDETVNFYSNNINRNGHLNGGSNLNNDDFSKNSGQNHNNNSGQNTSSLNTLNTNNSSTLKSNDKESYDLTMRLRYLEKSIKFIQQQHNETLNSLHQEIEKLKNENRELHFKLATRKNSNSSTSNSYQKQLSRRNSGLERNSSIITTTKITNLTDSTELKDPLLLKGFEKALKDTSKENDLDKRLNNIKTSYDKNKYDELETRLNDAESKNEYLSQIIGQLQSKRSGINSSYLNNQSVNVNNSNNNASSSNQLTKSLNLNNIYTVEPLRIKLNDNDEPRPPTLEESEIFISKLYDLYKHQKQQISNMKVVLKDMMQSENLSSQGMMMTKDVLDNNSSKFSQYLIDNTNGFQKLSIVTPITRISGPQSGLVSNRRYHSQFLATLASSNTSFNPIEVAASLSAANAVSSIHLPPLQTINPAKFPDRQRRTQVLQKQRLRRDYFH